MDYSQGVGAVLFAKNFKTLSEFYVATVGLELIKRGDDHTILCCPGFELVVHQIPEHLATSITIERPPKRRESIGKISALTK